MYSRFIFSVFVSISGVLARPDLFDDGQRGRILGSSFGVPGINATFDYVIVGGGTAGLTIAARLAEDPSLAVAVVEAGGFYEVDNGDLSVIPALAVFGSGSDPRDFQPLIDWGFVTTPQAVSLVESALFAVWKSQSILFIGSKQPDSTLPSWQDFGRFFCSEFHVLSQVRRDGKEFSNTLN